VSTFSLPLTQLIHENLSVIMTFCFSRHSLERLVDSRFQGEWKYLRKSLFEVSERRAEKACLELALFMRLLDDEQRMSEYLRQTGSKHTFGRLVMRDGSTRDLGLRDVANKIIHAAGLRWSRHAEDEPILLCDGSESEKWERAEINVVSLAAFCGELMH
jgi:hypothetical protein